ncbi:MAG: hypothetical protein HYY86_00850 [Candidatus Harrisonbacteria bacterium]|nr:hypothetical protein [Candidatus Harrisonbacteria bacterium]
MKYVDESVGSRFLPKLLGTYELEIAPTIRKTFEKSFEVIIDVGAAEGYYAVGMAMKNPKAGIIAFEADKNGRDSIEKMARINGVFDRIKVYGLCDAKSLTESIPNNKKCLIIMDIEGAEAILLDNFIIPKLNTCHIIVEIHDCCVFDGIGDMIQGRFKNTHKITEIWERKRMLEDFPMILPKLYNVFFKKYFIFNSMDEGRHDSLAAGQSARMRWFYLEPFNWA